MVLITVIVIQNSSLTQSQSLLFKLIQFECTQRECSCRVARAHGNVRVDPERPVAVLDRMKSAVVSVDAISRTRTECSR
jgi:hypothetical protein